MKISYKQKELFDKILEIFTDEPIYLVGGAVRDMLLGKEPHDYDFCTRDEPEMIEAKIRQAGKRAYLTGKKFGTIGFKIDGQMIEVTTFRSEEYEPGNRKPEVKWENNIVADLSRRDFTINAMALRLDKLRLIDPFGGKADLGNKIIRAVGFPKLRFKEDPLRILRAVRFATRFDYEIEEKTYEKMQHMAINILDISKERWMQELDKILQSENVSRGLWLLFRSGLFQYMIPELNLQIGYNQNSQYHSFNLDEHTVNVVSAVRKETDDLNLLWAALLHDIAKPFVRTDKSISYPNGTTYSKIILKSNYVGHEILGAEMVKRIAQHLKWSNERTEKVVDLVRHHLEDDCPLRKYDNEGKNDN